MANTYRYAVIGAGNMGCTHAKACKMINRAQVVAGADLNRQVLEKWAEQSGVTNLYGDYSEMLRRERPDMVSICVQANLAPDIVVGVAGSGIVKGILCEKPPAQSMADARRMVAACEQAGVKLAVNHQRRFMKWHRKTKQLLEAGVIGDLAFMWASVTTVYHDPLVWMTHVTDMMRFYVGDVEWLLGQVGPLSDQTPHGGKHHYPLSLVGYMAFRGGLRAVIEFDQGLSQIRLVGEKGQIVAPMDAPLKMMTAESPEWFTPDTAGCGAEDSMAAFVAAIDDVLDAIEHDKPPQNNGREGIAALEVLLAVYESARTHARVDFPLKQEQYPLAVI